MLFARNIGLIDEDQQARLAAATVLICGTGGMGGVCAEVLVRSGVGRLVLADHDCFEPHNTNRQIHCDQSSIGRPKAEVLGEAFRRTNPNMIVDVHTDGVTPNNVEALLHDADVVVNGMDQMRASLLLERTARRLRKTIVDAWLTPFGSVFVMGPDSPHWEDFLDMPTRGVPWEELTDELCQQALRKEIDYTLSFGDPYRYVDRGLVDEVVRGTRPRPSLAPIVWLSGVLMANEVFKFLVGLPVTDHVGAMYDQVEHRVLSQGESTG